MLRERKAGEPYQDAGGDIQDQDGGVVRCEAHLCPQYINNTSTCRVICTEYVLNTGRRPQTSERARKSPCRWVGQKKNERERNCNVTCAPEREL